MPDASDMDLVREYGARQSEPAFETLIRRHIHLVYSAAWRQTGNPAQAEEITQAVFIVLARKAAHLRPDTVLAAWLHETTRHVAASFLRGELRRRRREQEAYMQSTLQPSADDSAWEQLAPLLDGAIGRLGAADRNLVVLRYFQNRSVRDIAAALNIGEAAARKRLTRAVERLRRDFFKRGINVSAAALSGAVLTHSVQIAPDHLMVSVLAAAHGAAASSSTLTLVKGALKIMAWTKAKTAIIVGAAALLAIGTGTVIEKRAAFPNAWADDPGYWRLNNPPLATYPPVLILRPTRFSGHGGGIGNWNRWMERDMAVEDLVAIAYDFQFTRIIFPEDFPRGPRYDLMLTLRNHPQKALRDEIAKRFGLVGQAETVVTNALLVRVATPDAPGLKPASRAPGQGPGWFGGNRSLTIHDQPLDYFLSGFIESEVRQPVFNETGSTGKHDLHLQWNQEAGETDQHAFERALREQLGLELVPTNLPVKMLVVTKIK